MSRDLWEIGRDADQAQQQLSEISVWIDEHNEGMDPMFSLVMRYVKVIEELGETVAEIIGMLGQNPRKGVTSTLEDVIKEGNDTALTILGANESARGNKGLALEEFFAHVGRVHARMLQAPSALADVGSDVKIDKVLDEL